MTEPRILTDDETYQRRAQQASNQGPKTVELCAIRHCQHIAANGPFCTDHRRQYEPVVPDVVAAELTDHQLDHVRQQVEADAAVLTLLAFNWIARQQLTQLDMNVDQLAANVHRIQGELETGR